jgi:hypothetical protein
VLFSSGGSCNNLWTDLSLEVPKRRPTVATRLSASKQYSTKGRLRFLRRTSCGCWRTRQRQRCRRMRSSGRAEQIHAEGVGRSHRVHTERLRLRPSLLLLLLERVAVGGGAEPEASAGIFEAWSEAFGSEAFVKALATSSSSTVGDCMAMYGSYTSRRILVCLGTAGGGAIVVSSRDTTACDVSWFDRIITHHTCKLEIVYGFCVLRCAMQVRKRDKVRTCTYGR